MVDELSEVEFVEQLRTFERTAFRLELQPVYLEPVEAATVAKFLAGDPEPPTEVESLDAWFSQVTRLTRQGRRIQRVRVHEEPPTGYQRWERWIGRWNLEAGEEIRYVTRQAAHQAGLLPEAGDKDWWLLDASRLIVMTFDGQGHRIHNELVTDDEVVAQSRAWWDLAVRCSVPADEGAAA